MSTGEGMSEKGEKCMWACYAILDDVLDSHITEKT